MRLTALASIALAATATALQLPFADSSPLKEHKTTYDVFLKHFSADRPGTDVVLQAAIEDLHPNKFVATTQDRAFNLLLYANEHEDILIGEDLSFRSLERIEYRAAKNRKDHGYIGTKFALGGFAVQRGDEQMQVVSATWGEGYSQIVQWHIIGDSMDLVYGLMTEVMEFCTTMRDGIWVFDDGQWSADKDLYEAIQSASWDDVVLDAEFKNALQHDYRSFFKSKKTYERLNVPWKRGIIFLGPPGNGKTISLKAIMHEIEDDGIPALYVKTLHYFWGDEQSLKAVFSKARSQAPCILIFEDLDSLINDENRSYFLNEVDGLAENDGILMIGTTNHFDRLDPGMASRPSRFDRKYMFPNPEKVERRAYAVYWQKKLKGADGVKFPDALVDEFADKTKQFSFAFLKEAFISALLRLAADGGDFKDLLLEQVKNLRKELEQEDVAAASDAPSAALLSPI